MAGGEVDVYKKHSDGCLIVLSVNVAFQFLWVYVC